MGKGNMLRNYATQRDLFSESSGYMPGEQLQNSGKDNIRQPGPEVSGTENKNQDLSDTYVNKIASGNDYKSESSALSGITNVNNEKTVSRIVIFYTDKSFDEYSPA
jgi:hypothetical protein